jgi:FixJ family two-component response regulator
MSPSPTIYIVDDDPAVRAGISLLVRACGWRPEPCSGVQDFLDTYARDRAGCLIVDLQMPGLSGADLLDVMAGLGIRLPTIVVTAFPDHPLARRAVAAGARAVVSKPFRDEHLVVQIEAALATAEP